MKNIGQYLKKHSKGITGSFAFTIGNFDNLLNPSANTSADPKSIVVKLINYSLFFIAALALVFIIYGGILYVTSGGDAEKTTKARNTLLYAIIGIVVVVLAYAIVNWAGNLGGTLK